MTPPAVRRGLSRRQFVLGAAALGGLTAAGCSTSDASKSRDVALTDDGELTIWTWGDYIDPPDDNGAGGTLLEFQSQSTTNLDYVVAWPDSATSWEAIRDQVLTGSGWLAANLLPIEDDLLNYVPVLPDEGGPVSRRIFPDIMVPTNWLAARLTRLGALEPLPIEAIPNRIHLDPAFLTMDWDRGARFHLPWQSGLTGVAWDPARVVDDELPMVESITGSTEVSTELLFGEQFRGRVAMIGEMREAVGLAMLHLRDRSESGVDLDPTRPTLEAATEALDFLVDLHAQGQFTGWFFDDFAGELSAGNAAVSMAWSGSVVLLQADEPDRNFQFRVPGEGCIQWFDTMVIPADAQSVGPAAEFMNYVYDPTNAAQITAYLGYISPVLGVQDLLRADPETAAMADDPLIFPDAAIRQRLFTWGSMDLDDEQALEERFANEFL